MLYNSSNIMFQSHSPMLPGSVPWKALYFFSLTLNSAICFLLLASIWSANDCAILSFRHGLKQTTHPNRLFPIQRSILPVYHGTP